MRLAGHELVREGAPYDATTGARARWHGTGGEGCANLLLGSEAGK